MAGALLIALSGGRAWTQDPRAEADGLYREAVALLQKDLSNETLAKALALLERAAAQDPGREEVWIEISWRAWMLGDDLPKGAGEDKKKRLAYFDKGMAAGKKAIELNPKSVGGLYWYSVNMAAGGEMKGVLSSLTMAGELFSNISRVDRRDPYYLYGATRRFGSEIFVRIPPFLSEQFGFKPAYLEEDLLANIEKWPHYFDNYLYLAHVYVWNKTPDKALDMLDFILKSPPEIMPEERAENARTQLQARKYWKEITGKDWPER
jgi:tetratricopeptide (TPR) repeat protein